jgi:CRP/FNR family transcriptional regulator, cyclic AMP receptor protein
MSSSTEPKQAPSEYRANLELLMQMPLFSGLPLEALKLLAYLCKRESFKPDEVIFRQYEVDANAYYILQGTARLVLENGEEVLLTEYGEGAFIGGQSLFCDTKRLFTLRASTPLTCLVLSREKFQKTLEQFPEIAGRMFQAIVVSIHHWESRFVTQHARECQKCQGSLGITLT